MRGKLQLPVDTPQEEVRRAAFAVPAIRRWTQDKEIIREVFVPNRLLNVVVKE